MYSSKPSELRRFYYTRSSYIIFICSVKAVSEVMVELSGVKLYILNKKSRGEEASMVPDSITSLNEELSASPKSDLTEDINEGDPTDKLLFIYTSGTTGMPKAAVITNNRLSGSFCNFSLARYYNYLLYTFFF